jgi:chaperonin cofactor prefoldin
VENMGQELAALKEQLKAIGVTLAEVKSTLSQLTRIDRDVVQMRVIQGNHEEKLAEMAKSAEELENRVRSHGAYINKLRGSFSLITLLITVVQAIVLAGSSWILNSVIAVREDVSVLTQRVHTVEKTLGNLTQLPGPRK